MVIKCPSLSTISTDAGPPITMGKAAKPSQAFDNSSLPGKALDKVRISALEAIPALYKRIYSSKALEISCTVVCPTCFSSRVIPPVIPINFSRSGFHELGVGILPLIAIVIIPDVSPKLPHEQLRFHQLL